MPDVGIELGAACMPSELASDRATAPGSFRWDLEGCSGLNTKKNEKNSSSSLKGALQEKKRVMRVVVLTDNLILWVVCLNSN